MRRLLLILLAALSAVPAQAQGNYPRDAAGDQDFQIYSVNKAKRTVVVDGGSDAGLTVGRPLCFYDKGSQLIGCFPITGIHKDESSIQVPKAVMPKMKKGVLARAAVQRQMPSRLANPTAGPAYPGGTSRPVFSHFDFGYVFAPVMPFAYDAIFWDMTGRQPGKDGVWKKQKTVNQSIAGGHLAFATQLNQLMGFELGLIYRYSEDFVRFTDFDAADPGLGASTRMSALSFSVPLTLTERLGGPPVEFVLGQGFEADMSQVRTRVDTLREGSTERTRLVDYLSLLNTVGLRFDFAAALRFGQGSSVKLGVAAILPLAPFGKQRIVSLHLPSNLPADRDQEADLVAAINHRKSNVAVDMPLTVSLAF